MENMLCEWSGTHIFHQGKCRRCDERQPNDLDAWARTALDNRLRVISLTGLDGQITEIVIINESDHQRGYLWIKPYRLIGCDAGKIDADLDPGDALAMIAKLKRPITYQERVDQVYDKLSGQ